MKKELFSDSYEGNPKIYAYSDSHPQYEGLLKIGYTSRKTVQERVKNNTRSFRQVKKHILFILTPKQLGMMGHHL